MNYVSLHGLSNVKNMAFLVYYESAIFEICDRHATCYNLEG